jgi:hypothetical protein
MVTHMPTYRYKGKTIDGALSFMKYSGLPGHFTSLIGSGVRHFSLKP